MNGRLLNRNEVCRKTGHCYTTLWRWMRDGKFPRGVVANDGSVRWFETEVDDWIASLPRQRLKGDDEGEAA